MAEGLPPEELPPAERPPLGWAWSVLLAAIILMLVLTVMRQLRLAGVILGGTLALLALARGGLPSSAMGALAVRSKTADVLLYGATAAALLVVSLSLRIP